MRKQITIPNSLDLVVKKFAEVCNVSESAVISYAVELLTIRFNCSESINEEHTVINRIKDFYKNFYCVQLPRGKYARKRRIKSTEKTSLL